MEVLLSLDYDLIIIGAGVGGHGAALHAVEKGLKTAIIEGVVIGGTCVNRGCVPSKALLAVSGRMRELQSDHHLKDLGLQVHAAGYDRQGVADHANNLASKIRNNLTNSMKAIGVDILTGVGTILGPQKVKFGKVGLPDNVVTAKDIIIATGSVPFVPIGIEIDGKTVITSDHALKLESVPEWIAIVGSGYIGLEFSDVYTALGSEPVHKEFQGLHNSHDTGVEQVTGKDHVLNHLSIPAACFTHPEISMVGLTEPQGREKAEKEGFEIGVAKTSFKANTKALAENEGEGLAKLIYRPDNGDILGVHIFGLHAADLIHEASIAIALGTRIQDLKYAVQAHPTLSEVLDELFKSAKVNALVSTPASEPIAA